MTTTSSPSPRIVLAGGSGFLGRQLAPRLVGRGFDVVILTRSARPTSGRNHTPGLPGIREVAWDGRSCGPWHTELEGALGLVNLAGRTVNCRPTAENWAQVLASRVESARALGEACRRCGQPPRIWVQSGALAIYGDTGDEVLDESSPPGIGHAVETCRQWETACQTALPHGARLSILRIGIVLGTSGGALATLARLARLGLGGSAGNGHQWVSWIHEDDMLAAIEFALFNPGTSGVFNACTPNPVRNREFMGEIRRAVNRPWSPPAPALAIRLGAWLMGTDARLALTGRRCVPSRLTNAGFQFVHPGIRGALGDLLGAGALA